MAGRDGQGVRQGKGRGRPVRGEAGEGGLGAGQELSPEQTLVVPAVDSGVGGKVGAHCLACWSLWLTREGRPELRAQRLDVEKRGQEPCREPGGVYLSFLRQDQPR